MRDVLLLFGVWVFTSGNKKLICLFSWADFGFRFLEETVLLQFCSEVLAS